jgi:hypothetical protein
MTVCRRPVASWKPQSVGNSGLDRVGTRKTGVKVPPPTPTFSRKPWSETSRRPPKGSLSTVSDASCLRMSLARVSEWFL